MLLLLGGMVIPLDELPSGLRAVAEVLPAAALAEVFHGALGGGSVPARRVDRPGRVGGRRAAGGRGRGSAGSEHGRGASTRWDSDEQGNDQPRQPGRPPAEPPALTGPVAVVRR